jgi:hypothetical protein
MRDLDPLLLMFVEQIHVDVIWTVGILLAIRRWRRHPQVSLLILIAFTLELAQSIGGVFAQYSFRAEMQEMGRRDSEAVITKYIILHWVRWGLEILGWTLILIAIFRWRYPPNRVLGHDEQYLPEDFGSKRA